MELTKVYRKAGVVKLADDKQEGIIYMKKSISTAVVSAIALVAMSGVADAQSTHTTSQTTFSNAGIQAINQFAGPEAATVTYNVAQGIEGARQSSGSRYQQTGTAPDNTEAAVSSITNSFTLKGNVSTDCSFYGGGSTDHTIDLGTIGVRTGNNDNVSIAFNQNSNATANVNSATAGCNTNNIVTITKTNGSDGMLNTANVNFNSDEFTNKIPYSIAASWTGVVATGPGSVQNLAVAANQAQNTKTGGAWRSAFNMNVLIPAQSKGLVAGNYSDVIKVTLAAL